MERILKALWSEEVAIIMLLNKLNFGLNHSCTSMLLFQDLASGKCDVEQYADGSPRSKSHRVQRAHLDSSNDNYHNHLTHLI